MEDFGGVVVLSILAALVCTILLFVMVLPENKRNGLNPFFKKVADIFNFKNLLLEGILKFCYTFLTLLVVAIGVLGFLGALFGGSDMTFAFLLILIIGPIVIRIVYELSMMFILLLKNVMEINKKLSSAQEKEVPVTEISGERVCSICGQTEKSETAAFCTKCGNKF